MLNLNQQVTTYDLNQVLANEVGTFVAHNGVHTAVLVAEPGRALSRAAILPISSNNGGPGQQWTLTKISNMALTDITEYNQATFQSWIAPPMAAAAAAGAGGPGGGINSMPSGNAQQQSGAGAMGYRGTPTSAAPQTSNAPSGSNSPPGNAGT
jgi:hypothetical protein